jgi:SAM-dependent methyltransferase
LELALPIRPCPIGDSYVTKDQLHTIQELYPMDLYLCMDCAHLQLPTVIDPKILFSNYTYKTSSSHGLVNHFEQYAQNVFQKLDLKAQAANSGLVVEIGSNDGTLLKCFQKRGFRVLGIDPAEAIAAESTVNGVETLPTFFNEAVADQILATKGRASLICANNVFAHADDMMGIAAGISKLLSKDGVFVFEVSYLLDLVNKNVFDTIYHEHLCHHAIGPLAKFLRRFGMTLFDVERVDSKGGSIRCFAQPNEGPRSVSSQIQKMIDLEIQQGFDRLSVYSDFGHRLEKLREDFHLFLDAARAKGKKISGYGASNPNTTIVFHLELGEYFSTLYDDNPVKQGMFSPRLHIPVVPSEHIYDDRPDYLVLLAWAFADPIQKRHQRYLKACHGRFIVPIPEMRLIG